MQRLFFRMLRDVQRFLRQQLHRLLRMLVRLRLYLRRIVRRCVRRRMLVELHHLLRALLHFDLLRVQRKLSGFLCARLRQRLLR